MEQRERGRVTTDPDVVGAQIVARLAERRRAPLALTSARILPAGASRSTYLLTFDDASGTAESVIVRGVPTAHDDGGLAAEARVLAAATDAGVPVPAVLDSGFDPETSALGFAYLVMDFVAGESIPRRILRDDEFARARAVFVEQAGTALAAVHRIDQAAVRVPAIGDPIEALAVMFEREYERMPAGLQLATRWLADHRPPASPDSTLVHGDFRLGNLLVDAEGIAAVLDWELVHLGDPVEDLGWLCAKAWRFGAPAPVAGLGERADLLDAYAAAAGWRPSEEALRWWELYATVRWGLICALQANRHLDGAQRSVELAAIGRRSAEQEFDALLALGIVVPEVVDDPLLSARPRSEDPYGPPGAPQLLEAVAEFLRSAPVADAMPGQAGFHTRVAANVIDVVARQLLLAPAASAASTERLVTLGVTDQHDLVAALRDGRLDADDPAVRSAVAADVRARLLVSNPRYLGMPNR